MQPPPDEFRRALLTALPLLALGADAGAQDATKVQAQSYRVALENDHVRVLEFNSRPGMGVCGDGLHSHPAHLTVLLSGASVRIKAPDGRITEQRGVPEGTVFWSEAETHVVENISGNDIHTLIVEIKTGRA